MLKIQADFALFMAFLVLVILGIFLLLPSALERPKHFACVNQACVEVEGAGPDYCSDSQDCAPKPTVFESTVQPSVPAEFEETPLANLTRECAEKFSYAFSKNDVSSCVIDGCPLSTHYCQAAVADFECVGVVQGSGNQSKRDLCELNFAINSGGIEQCGYLPEPAKQYCIALKEKSVAKCSEIPNKFLKDICPGVIGVLTKNKRLCSEDYAECFALIGG
ncbi:MAG: hypothetical protein QXR53_01020 [Candidatus Norongarragalinales archaeon]